MKIIQIIFPGPFQPGLFYDSKYVQINLCPDKQNRYDDLMAKVFFLDSGDYSPTSGSLSLSFWITLNKSTLFLPVLQVADLPDKPLF